VWGDENIQQQLDGAVRNKGIYQKIASMGTTETGYNVEIKLKI
jgi:hypothetical protein